MTTYYKVTNVTDTPLVMPWVKTLLNDEDREAYEDYKTTPEYIGIRDEDRAARTKIPEAVKVKNFYDKLGKGVRVKTYEQVAIGDQVITNTKYEYQFCIGPDIKKIIDGKNINRARKMCEQYDVPIKREDDIKAIAGKMSGHLGPNEIVVTDTQWHESGLSNFLIREITVMPKPGSIQTKAIVKNDGMLIAEELSDIEAEEYADKKNGNKE